MYLYRIIWQLHSNYNQAAIFNISAALLHIAHPWQRKFFSHKNDPYSQIIFLLSNIFFMVIILAALRILDLYRDPHTHILLQTSMTLKFSDMFPEDSYTF